MADYERSYLVSSIAFSLRKAFKNIPVLRRADITDDDTGKIAGTLIDDLSRSYRIIGSEMRLQPDNVYGPSARKVSGPSED